MLFITFNAVMVGLLVIAAYQGWRYWGNKQERSVSAFIAIICGSIFSFYVIALGVTTAVTTFWEGVRLSAGAAITALFAHF
jgi:hypothetical protein